MVRGSSDAGDGSSGTGAGGGSSISSSTVYLYERYVGEDTAEG